MRKLNRKNREKKIKYNGNAKKEFMIFEIKNVKRILSLPSSNQFTPFECYMK